MKILLNGYDTSYHYGSDPNLDQHIDKLNSFLQGTGGIVYPDENDRVFLNLQDDLPSRVTDHAKSISRDLLDVMGVDPSKNKYLSYPTRKIEVSDYELEKVDKMRQKFEDIAKPLAIIHEYLNKANELGIDVRGIPGYFNFAEFYNSHMKLIRGQRTIDFTELDGNISKFNIGLQKAVLERQNVVLEGQKNQDVFNVSDYELEKVDKMRQKFEDIAKSLAIIHEYLNKANELGIDVRGIPGYFNFAEFYNSHMKLIRDQRTIEFTELYRNIYQFNASLQNVVLEGKKMQDRIE